MAAVLIVDDEPQVREVLRRWLQSAGYETAEAPDASAALETLQTSAVAAVLCDVRMPGRDGLWLVQQIRAQFPTVGLVFATAEDRLPPKTTLQDGVVAYVVKPFDRYLVIAAVDRAVQWHEQAKSHAARPAPERTTVDRWLDDDAGG
jgi:CheY-like chemotaxis protein